MTQGIPALPVYSLIRDEFIVLLLAGFQSAEMFGSIFAENAANPGNSGKNQSHPIIVIE